MLSCFSAATAATTAMVEAPHAASVCWCYVLIFGFFFVTDGNDRVRHGDVWIWQRAAFIERTSFPAATYLIYVHVTVKNRILSAVLWYMNPPCNEYHFKDQQRACRFRKSPHLC